MNKMTRKTLILTVTIMLILSAIYMRLGPKPDNPNKQDNIISLNQKEKISGENTKDLSAWVAYWDLNCDKDITALDNELKNLSYFAVNYTSNNELVMPDKLIDYYNETKNYKYNKYITIVNDKINSDGSSSLKDIKLLKALLSDTNERSRHIEEIIRLAEKYNFNGIEIDYEKIRNDMKLWDEYILFINDLYHKAKKEGLELRVILEPNAPIEKLNFEEGPTYVMMCYNLHGDFSEPGSKANPEFIKSLIKKMVNVPGKKDFAIATGGFNWAANGKTTSISEIEADGILKKYKAEAERDDESQSLFFKYKDENNIEHEIWYADKVTLKFWIKIITEGGYGVSIWRLGGNLF